ncbi:MAG: ArnT family glycosyltransferase [Owenweeksia sp.]
MSLNRHKITLLFILLIYLLAVYFPIFLKLDAKAVRVFDESRLTITAYEMVHNGNYLIPHYAGAPEMWSVKPPLMIWLQTLGIRAFGYNELGVRIPAALAALSTCLLLFFFSGRIWKSYWPGFIAGIVLVTARGYVHEHGIRTGDYDSLLVFCTTAYALFFFLFLQNGKVRNLYATFVFLTLAILTKGIAALLMLPALFLYSLFRGKLKTLLRTRHFYIGMLIPIIFGLGYYPLREIYNPGYLQAVWDNELGGRFLDTLEGHQHPFLYYIEQIMRWRLAYWIYFIIPAVVIGFFFKDKKLELHFFSVLAAFSFLLIISLSQTKLEWYDLQAYPFIAIIIGGAVFWVISLLTDQIRSTPVRWSIFLALVILTLWLPYRYIFEYVYRSAEDPWSVEGYRVEYYMQQFAKQNEQPPFDQVAYEGYNTPILFYLNQYEEDGFDVSYTNKTDLQPGFKVMASEEAVKMHIEQNYRYEVVDQYYNVAVYEIKSPE